MYVNSDTDKKYISIGEHIKKMRLQRGISAYELALKSGIYASVVTRLEKGEHDPRWSTLLKIISGYVYSLLFSLYFFNIHSTRLFSDLPSSIAFLSSHSFKFSEIRFPICIFFMSK